MKRDVLQLSVIVVWKQEAIAQSKELVRLAADTAATTEPDREREARCASVVSYLLSVIRGNGVSGQRREASEVRHGESVRWRIGYRLSGEA